jgi:hypothetical protein
MFTCCFAKATMKPEDWDNLAKAADDGHQGQGKIVRAVQEANRSTPTMLCLMRATVVLAAIAAAPALIHLWHRILAVLAK